MQYLIGMKYNSIATDIIFRQVPGVADRLAGAGCLCSFWHLVFNRATRNSAIVCTPSYELSKAEITAFGPNMPPPRGQPPFQSRSAPIVAPSKKKNEKPETGKSF